MTYWTDPSAGEVIAQAVSLHKMYCEGGTSKNTHKKALSIKPMWKGESDIAAEAEEQLWIPIDLFFMLFISK